MRSSRWLTLAAIALLLSACVAREVTAREFTVQRVVDGDTLVIVYDGEPTRLRLQHVDAPELREHGGPEARAALAQMAEGRRVRIDLVDPRGKRDRFGRLLAIVYDERGRDLGAELVRAGLASPRGTQ